ncbi:BspA family leucine-rich repeat surface protein, partial [Muricauda oceani]
PVMEDQELTVAEDITDTDEIGQVEATDNDKDDTLKFSIVENDNDLFLLSDAGVLTLAEGKTLDYETATSHSITVSVTDGEKTDEAKIAILVENVAEAIDPDDPTSFVTKWETTTPEETIYIGANADYAYDFTVDWGDGTVETINELPENHMFEHTYQEPGIHTVAIQGTFPAIHSEIVDNDQLLKLVGLERWGTIVWQDFAYAFSGCENMVYNATDAPDLSNVTSLLGMFNGASSFNGDLNDWDTETITDMSYMFEGATSFNGDISSWDTYNVAAVQYMFRGATSFNGDLSDWDTTNVTDMQSMFEGATSFNGDISGWETPNVTNLVNMFLGATSFDQNLGGWDISLIGPTSMVSMLDNSGMSPENYDKTLLNWAFLPQGQVPQDILFGGEGLFYCNDTWRNALMNTHGWEFIGDAPSPNCP